MIYLPTIYDKNQPNVGEYTILPIVEVTPCSNRMSDLAWEMLMGKSHLNHG